MSQTSQKPLHIRSEFLLCGQARRESFARHHAAMPSSKCTSSNAPTNAAMCHASAVPQIG